MTSAYFYLWIFGWPGAGLILGLAGLRLESLSLVLSVIGGAYSVIFFVYGLFRGGVNDCVGTGSSYVCHPTSFLADIGWYGDAFVTAVTLLTLAPLLSAWAGVRWPSIVAALILVFMFVANLLGLTFWLPAISGVIAAAIAGPPRPWRGPADQQASSRSR